MAAARLPQVSPEIELLLLCARTSLAESTRKRIQEIAGQNLDWEGLFRAAAEHSLIPLLCHRLQSVCPRAIPAVLSSELREKQQLHIVRTLFLCGELTKILDAFQACGIRAVPFKGPVVAVQAYGDAALREFEDLDFMLPQRDVPHAYAVMEILGYRPRFPARASQSEWNRQIPGEYVFFHREGRTLVELHTERTLRHFPAMPALDEWERSLENVRLAGRDVPAYTKDLALTLACVHGAKDFWSRLSWIADVAALAATLAEDEWGKTYRHAACLRAERMLDLGLALARGLLDAELPPMFRVRLQRNDAARRLAAQTLRRILRDKACAPGAWERTSFRVRSVEGILGGMRYCLRLTTTPAEEDWAAASLPRGFSAAYSFFRPFRLLGKYRSGNAGRGPGRGRS